MAFVNWLSAQLRRPSDPARSVPAAVGALASLLREKPVRQLFTRNGARLLSYQYFALLCAFSCVARSTCAHRTFAVAQTKWP